MNKSVEIQLSKNDSDDLYVFFGGLATGIAMPLFEFYQASKILDGHKMFVRDFRQEWYQGGLPSIGGDIYSVAQYLKDEIDSIGAKRVCFVGNSMGGYAAILFSCLIDSNIDVIAFAPQTFISPHLRLLHRDRRWQLQISKTYMKSLLKPKVWNLRSLLLRSDGRGEIAIFVSDTSRLDCVHASHIQDIENVTVHRFNSGGHGLVKMLRDQGLLPSIMRGEYRGEAGESA